MPSNQSKKSAEIPPVFELKGGIFTLPMLRLFATDMDAVAAGLSAKVDEKPHLFRNTPVVIDLKGLSASEASVEFPLLVGLLRGYGMVPVGVGGGNEAQNKAALAMELAIFPVGLSKKKRPAQRSPAEARQHAAKTSTTKVIEHPVRSGQRVYARGGDLVILSHVSSGAEVLADGDVHIYGALRGRALAGVKGNQDARLFCLALQSELVAIAGRYRVSDDIDADLLGKPAQIRLEKRTLKIGAFRATEGVRRD